MANTPKILIADDEPNLRRVLSGIIGNQGYEVVTAANGEEAIGLLGHGIDVVISDLKMPRIDGMSLLRHVVSHMPDVPVIIITAHGSVDNAVEAVKLGAFDYVEKPFEHDQITAIVTRAVNQARAAQTAPRFPLDEENKEGRFGLVGRSQGMQHIYTIIEKIADTPSTVLIDGESGTGKELVAKALHNQSSRRAQPFIKINCAAIPKNLVESELFGYEKGAFTGAVGAKPGRMELANEGTLFLDEIGEIPVEIQVKLLRALQESEFERVGGIKTISVDVRVITATNRDLEQEVKEGNFREDLYYRLNVVPISIPPLRDRAEDIALLANHIVQKFNLRLKKNVSSIDNSALKKLQAYSWPGNIRELENVLERTLLFDDSPIIKDVELPKVSEPQRSDKSDAPVPIYVSPSRSSRTDQSEHSLKEIVRAETERVERELIAGALEKTKGNVTQAAKLLQISRKSLQTKMKEFGLRDTKATP